MSTERFPAIDAPAAEWLVFADALQQKGDPLGELIALIDAADSTAHAEHLRAHATEILGADAAPHLDSYLLTWHYGRIERADVFVADNEDGVARLKALLASPLASQLRGLRIVGNPKTDDSRLDLTPEVSAALATMPETCTSLGLVDQRAAERPVLTASYFDPAANLVSFGDLGVVCSDPKVRDLEVVTADPYQLINDGLRAPELESFRLRNLRYAQHYFDEPSELTRWLAAATWPKLKRFEVRLVDAASAGVAYDSDAYTEVYSEERLNEDYDGGWWIEGTPWMDELEPLFASLGDLPLEHLGLTACASESFGSLADLLLVDLPRSVRVLDLSDGTVEISNLLVQPDVFAHLDRLIVHRTSLSEADAGKLAAALPCKVDWSPGHMPDYRFVVGSE